VPWQDGFIGVFRAEYVDGRPLLHLGFSNDALNWKIEEQPIKFTDEAGNDYPPKYAYDPRLVKVEDTYYIIWCTDFYGASLGLASTKDFKSFHRYENPFLPFNRNGVLFPRKFDDKFLLLSRPSDSGHTPFGDIFVSESRDLEYWGRHRHVMSKGGSGWWQTLKIGGGPAPIETSEGWLLLYHGVTQTCNGYVYSMGGAILDHDEPSRVLYRSKNFLLTPEMNYETQGFVDNVIFPCATLVDAATGRIAIYYGAADTYVGLAFSEVDPLVKYIMRTSEVVGDDPKIGRL
jgi:beta-1,4-mannooligosaccharide/beta-1,4-mannosyl-N-acetylglucosamine phosphorylase